MSPLYLYNGSLLDVAGGLAVSPDCCCQGCVYCSVANANNFYPIYEAPVNATNAPMAASGGKKTYSECAGLIRFDLYTGTVPDRFQAIGNGGVVLFDTGCVTHGGRITVPGAVQFGVYTFCKPEGITNIDMVHISCSPRATGYALRVSNCIIGPC